MNTLELTQAGNIDQIKRAEDVLRTASLSGEAAETGENSKKTSYSLAFNVITSILLILCSIAVLKVTGLYDGINSTTLKIALCSVTSYCYLIAFRRGLSSE